MDHVDLAKGRPPQLAPAGDGTLSLRVWLDVYIVTGQQLAACPNVVPQGATTPAGRMVATFVVSMSGERLTIVLDDLDSDPHDPPLEPLLGAVKSAMPLIPPVDFGPIFATLDLSAPRTSRIDLVDGVVALRFDPFGPATSRLAAGQDWAVFVGGADIEEFVRDRLSWMAVPHLTLTPHWTPAGASPRTGRCISI